MIKKVMVVILSICFSCSFYGCTSAEKSVVDENKIEQKFCFDTNLESKTYFPLSAGRIFYVSSSGSDSNDGLTKETPLKTITSVNNLSLEAGDSVLFKGGDAFSGTLRINNSGRDDNPITIGAYDNETKRPKLVSNLAHTIIFTNVSNLVIKDLQVVPVSNIRTSETPGPKQIGILGINDPNATGKNKNIYIHNNHVVSSGPTTNSDGIAFVGEYPSIADVPKEAVSNIYVTNNIVENVGRVGIYTSQNIKRNLYKNVNFIGNTVHNVGQIGMYIGSATNSKILRNVVYDTGLFNKPFVGEGECGIMAIACDTSDIMYNIAYANMDASVRFDAMGIDIDWNSKNINVQYNYLYNNKGGGVGTMANQNSAIKNNKIVNNMCETNMTGQIQVSSFTVENPFIEDDMHAVTNIEICDNLIISDKSNKNMFKTTRFNGDLNWSGNSFTKNHMISNTTTDDYWIELDAEVAWYKFDSNCYYKNNGGKFKCLDVTDSSKINTSDGASAYVFDGKFSSWQKRDLHSTYSEISEAVPSRISDVNASFKDGKLSLSWKKSEGNLWHYNIYCVNENEEIAYTNMLGEAFGESFEYTFENSFKKIIVIQPESNEGKEGQLYKIEVELK